MVRERSLLPRIAKAASALAVMGCLLGAGTAEAAGCSATAYWDWRFQGAPLRLAPRMAFVGQSWNDQISSIRVHSGIWRFYRHANFQGDYLEFGPGGYSFQSGDAWNDQISSVVCISPT